MDDQTAALRPIKSRTYTDEYRRQVVDMITSIGRTAMSVPVGLGIRHTLISRWMRRYAQVGQVLMPRLAPESTLKSVPVPHADQTTARCV